MSIIYCFCSVPFRNDVGLDREALPAVVPPVALRLVQHGAFVRDDPWFAFVGTIQKLDPIAIAPERTI